MNRTLCKLPILFSTVRPKVGPNFSQLIHRFKIRISECWLGQFFPISQRDFEIFECCSVVYGIGPYWFYIGKNACYIQKVSKFKVEKVYLC